MRTVAEMFAEMKKIPDEEGYPTLSRKNWMTFSGYVGKRAHGRRRVNYYSICPSLPPRTPTLSPHAASVLQISGQ